MGKVVGTDPDGDECDAESCTREAVATVQWDHGAVTYTQDYCKRHGYGLAPGSEVW